MTYKSAFTGIFSFSRVFHRFCKRGQRFRDMNKRNLRRIDRTAFLVDSHASDRTDGAPFGASMSRRALRLVVASPGPPSEEPNEEIPDIWNSYGNNYTGNQAEGNAFTWTICHG